MAQESQLLVTVLYLLELNTLVSVFLCVRHSVSVEIYCLLFLEVIQRNKYNSYLLNYSNKHTKRA